jgi:hypothetical protein
MGWGFKSNKYRHYNTPFNCMFSCSPFHNTLSPLHRFPQPMFLSLEFPKYSIRLSEATGSVSSSKNNRLHNYCMTYQIDQCVK